MRMILPVAVFSLAALGLHGCATREYTRQPPLSSFEATSMSCSDIDQEINKLLGAKEELSRKEQYRWYNVVAAVENNWIGNTRERIAAMESADARLGQLWKVRDQHKCDGAPSGPARTQPVTEAAVEERHDPKQPAATAAAQPPQASQPAPQAVQPAK